MDFCMPHHTYGGQRFFFFPGGDRNQTHVGLTAGTLTCWAMSPAHTCFWLEGWMPLKGFHPPVNWLWGVALDDFRKVRMARQQGSELQWCHVMSERKNWSHSPPAPEGKLLFIVMRNDQKAVCRRDIIRFKSLFGLFVQLWILWLLYKRQPINSLFG